ncbi:T9SS type A sorting domain-containing protein [Gaetbulibacter aquiaggeris]|uniref:T9SS type A sorting domain-containing protein n=1 Tax=Gaetbulibacter aquiaggeris TaxID=1735373 RepID=A0ABW7MM96_9FLAO
MMKKLLLFILPMMLCVVTLQAQNHVWDFGNDTTNWPVDAVGVTSTTVVDGLTLEPGGSSFAVIEANSATFPDGYTSINRFKFMGSSSIDPSDGSTFVPTRRFMTFPVDGPVAVKIWFRQSGTSLPRALWVTDGTSEVLHFDGLGDTDPRYIEANYNGGAGTLYVLCANNAYNLYKLEISSTLLGTNDFKAAIKTNLKAIGNRIYLSDVSSKTEVSIYSITGALVKSFKTNEDTSFSFKSGLWIATVKTEEGAKAFKLLTH